MRPHLPPRTQPGSDLGAALRAALVALLAASALIAAGDPAVTRIGGIDYVRLEDGASALGLRLVQSVPDTTVMLKAGSQPVAQLSDRHREIDLKGLRIFMGDPAVIHGGSFYVSRIDFETRLLPRLRPDLCGEPPAAPRVIAIDPGHGGTDPGGENRTLGTMEKTYTLDVSLRLRKLLEASGYKVVLTRDSDFDLPKPLRSEIANRAGADFFVSVHFNLIRNDTRTTGVEVMLFPPRSQRSTDSWSLGHTTDAEGKASPVNAFDRWNTILAGSLHRSLLEAIRDGDRGEKFEHLAVLRGLRCPGVLVEPAFISSGVEGAKLETPAFRDKVAAAIFAGIQGYAQEIRALRAPAASAQPAGGTGAPAGPAPRSPPTRPAAGP
jgi:N-acetylmuramoyl-L-alanine amidase